MVIKRYRFVAEFDFEIEDLSDKLIQEEYENYPEVQNSDWFVEGNERQKRFLQALLEDDELLAEFVKVQLFSDIEANVADLLKEKLNLGDDPSSYESLYEVLTPVVERLDAEDARVFNEYIQEEVLTDNLDLFFACFKLRLGRATISEHDISEGETKL